MNLDLLAEMVGISPWEIRYRNAVRPGQVLPNGQIADASTGIAETLEAVKEIYEKAPYAGIACAMKNAGVGVGLPDWGRCRLLVQKRNGTDSCRSFLHRPGTGNRSDTGRFSDGADSSGTDCLLSC